MQDFNYLSSNDFELTLELGCEKYPVANVLETEWERNRDALLNLIWQVRVPSSVFFTSVSFYNSCFPQAHVGIKGMVYNSLTNQGIPNAIVHVKNMTGGRPRDIQHDITSGKVTCSPNKYLSHAQCTGEPRHIGLK